MKTLYLLRHAKSASGEPGLDDFERPLNARGRGAAPLIGRHLRDAGARPDLVLCSSARRARETWEGVAAELGGEIRVEHRRELYLASPGRMLSVLAGCDAGLACLLLVGHNPGIEDLAARLAGPGSAAGALAALQAKYPSGALAVFDFEVPSWADLEEEGGQLRAFVRPRDL